MKLGMIFSGYGSVFVGMGKELYDESRAVQEVFEEASNCLDKNFVKLCFASSDTEIKTIENAYLTLFVVSVSVAELLKEAGIEAVKVAGYDVGEYAALTAIKGISNPDALYLLNKYAQLYQPLLDKDTFAVVRVIGMKEPEIKALCMQVTGAGERADIAVFEHIDRFVVSGTKDAMAEFKEAVQEKSGVKVIDLHSGCGLHSPLMDEIVKSVKMYLEKVDFKDTTIPFISSVIGEPLLEGDKIRASLMQSIHAPIQWAKVMQQFKECDIIVEVGPGTYVHPLLQQVFPDKKIYRILEPKDVEQLKKDMA